MEQHVVGAILAQDEISPTGILLIPIDVVDVRLWGDCMAQGFLDN